MLLLLIFGEGDLDLAGSSLHQCKPLGCDGGNGRLNLDNRGKLNKFLNDLGTDAGSVDDGGCCGRC